MRFPIALAAAVLIATPALADPCKAIPDKGRAPGWLDRGAAFAGPVVYVGDGDSLCVDARGAGPAGWVEVRLADFYAPEISSPEGPAAKAALEKVAKGRRVDCVAGKRSYDRVVAACTLSGRNLGEVLRAAGVPEGGRGR